VLSLLKRRCALGGVAARQCCSETIYYTVQGRSNALISINAARRYRRNLRIERGRRRLTALGVGNHSGSEPMQASEGIATRVLDAEGNVVGSMPAFATDVDELLRLYRALVLTRAFDTKAVALQRTGRLGTYASSLGQEAVSVGAAAAMLSDDVFVPSFREHGGQLWRGVTLQELFLYWGGDERGNDFSGPRQDFPICVPVGSHAPHAVGVALAFRMRGEKRAAVCVFGDGATSKGDVAEALNMAGVWKVPAVFVINNNGWAISVPRDKQSAAATLAQKAVSAGIPGEQVDGNDVIAVRTVTERALARARQGLGPSLIEAVTYRLCDHTTADDASRYRDDAEVSRHWPFEPLVRLRNFLSSSGHWDKNKEDALLHECSAAVEQAAADYLAMPPQLPSASFDFVYAVAPAELVEQRKAVCVLDQGAP
jgi:2-oxoisovalerate dehydrogenase E1 component alpha subunit